MVANRNIRPTLAIANRRRRRDTLALGFIKDVIQAAFAAHNRLELREAPWGSSRDEVPPNAPPEVPSQVPPQVPPKAPPKVPLKVPRSLRDVLCGTFFAGRSLRGVRCRLSCSGSCPAEAGQPERTLRPARWQDKTPEGPARRVSRRPFVPDVLTGSLVPFQGSGELPGGARLLRKRLGRTWRRLT